MSVSHKFIKNYLTIKKNFIYKQLRKFPAEKKTLRRGLNICLRLDRIKKTKQNKLNRHF